MRVPLPEYIALWVVLRNNAEVTTDLLLTLATLPKLRILDLSQASWPSGASQGRVIHTLTLILRRGSIRHIFLPRLADPAIEFPEDWPLGVQTIEAPLAPREEVWRRVSREAKLCECEEPTIKFLIGPPSAVVKKRARRYRRIPAAKFN